MSKQNRKIVYYFLDILEAIEDIQKFISDLDYTDFCNDRKTIYALIRCLEIIREAVKNIPKEMKNKYPHIPWRAIAGMRDKLIHAYLGIDVKLIWDTVCNDIPFLKQELLKIKEREFKS